MDLRLLSDRPLTSLTKGVPNGVDSLTIDQVGKQGWNVLNGDLPLPLALLKQTSLEQNSRWMQAYLEATGAQICPHGKTTMAPQLFDQQLKDGAWGVTIANVAQLKVCRAFGVSRVMMANQLVGQPNIEYVFLSYQKILILNFIV